MTSRERALSNVNTQNSINLKQEIPYLLPNRAYSTNRSNKSGSLKNDISFQAKKRSLVNSALDLELQKKQFQPEVQQKSFNQNKFPKNQNGNNMQLKNLSTTQSFRNTKHNHNYCVLDQQKFNQTKNKLTDINFSHHDPNQCVCNICTCGRHLCKLHVVKPEMQINSIYRNDFHPKNPLQPLYLRPTSSKRFNANGPNLDIRSTYGKDFYPKKPGVQKLHPEDCLPIGGPASNLTSYSSGFPGHKGPNQYIKPTFNANNNGLMPFQGNSIYDNSYNGQQAPRSDLAKWTNHFKIGQPWLGNSMYRQKFKQPQTDQYPKILHIQQKLQLNPDFKHQYETIYKNDFLNGGPTVCPAKVKIQGEKKGSLRDSKGVFNQNSDYKALSPDFHAISTSKHSYV